MDHQDFKAEISKYDPPINEKRRDAFISLYYVVFLVLCGFPMWFLTTTTYRASLPISDISKLVESKINIVIKVTIINFDANVDLDDLFKLQDKLIEEFSINDKNKRTMFVILKHNVFVRQASKEELKIYQFAKSFTDLEKITSNLHSNDIYFMLLPETSNILANYDDGLIRNKMDRNVVLLKMKSIEQNFKMVTKCVTNLMARNDDLNVVYRAALEVPEKGSNENNIPRRLRPFLKRIRTAAKYEWTFSLIVPHPKGGQLREWDFPTMEHLYLEPLVRKLAPYVEVRISSQIIYGVQLEHIWPSKIMKGGPNNNNKNNNNNYIRVYSREDLTHIVNGIETYLGSNKGLQFVSYLVTCANDSSHINSNINDDNYVHISPQLYLEGHNYHSNGQQGVNAFTVPRWGGVLLKNNATIPLDGEQFMTVFLSQIRSLMGLDRNKHINIYPPSLFMEPYDISAISMWQLHMWLRERTVENLAITQLTLRSILDLLDKVGNMVIRDDVATYIHTATRLSLTALDALQTSNSDSDNLSIAFLASKQALQAAETAFFHPSLLELLYFQDDQKIGIYIPLFVPVILPVFLAALRARPFLLSLFKNKCE